MMIRRMICGLALALVSVANLNADVIARFDDDSGALNAVDILPSAEIATGVSTLGVSQTGLANFTNPSTWPVGQWDADFNLAKFVSVTITPDAISTISFTDVTWAKGFFNPTGAEVRTSQDSFASSVASTGDLGNTGGEIAFDLSSLAPATSATEFRFYFSGASAFSDLATVNGNGLTFNGTVVAVPEPSSCLALLAFGGLAGFVRRRR